MQKRDFEVSVNALQRERNPDASVRLGSSECPYKRPELISGNLSEWCETNGVTPEFIKPGKPAQNAYIEGFNRSYRQGVLNMYLFDSLKDVRQDTGKREVDKEIQSRAFRRFASEDDACGIFGK